MGKYIGIAGALGLIAYVGFVGGLVDYFFPPQAEVAIPSPRGEPAAVLSFPIPYSATVTQYGDGIKEPRTRFYVARSVREEDGK